MSYLNNSDPLWGAVVIRRAVAGDRSALLTLAQLDTARPLTYPVLVGELRGKVVAALDLSDRRVIADPFVPTAQVVELLRVRAKQVALDMKAGENPRHDRPMVTWRHVLDQTRPALP